MSIISPITAPDHRVPRSFACRTQTAGHDAFVPPPAQVDNGDEALYPDKSGTYTKGVLQTGVGLVDLAAYQTFINALKSGDPADFEKIVLGGPRTLNGPQGGLAFGLECLDLSQFGVAPAPALASEEYAAELVELYWASLLRDVAFTQYSSDPVAVNAAAELSSLASYRGPRDAANNVTPNLLFRGGFAGDTIGPYMSQFLLQDTVLGALPITQQYVTFKKGVDYMLDKVTFQQVQNGIATGLKLQPDVPLYLHNGRGLAAYTHSDVLYQAYLTAYLVLNTINGGNPVPLNPGNPYNTSKTQNGFGTLGQPDIAATLTAVAREALNAVWYQKMVCAPSPSSGIGRRHRLFDPNWRRRPDPGPRQRHSTGLQGGAERLRNQQQLFPVTGVSRGFADASGLSDRTRRCGGGLHHRPQVFLRRRFCPAEPEGSVKRRDDTEQLQRPRCRAADGQRRIAQAGAQHQLRSRHSCRFSLAQRHRDIDPAG